MVTAIRHGDQSDAVERLQAALMALGFDLPRFGVDGQAGGETFDAINEYCRRHGLPAVERVIAPTLAGVVEAFADLVADRAGPPELPDWIHDYTGQHRDRMGPPRGWASVTGITLHQTATAFSSSTEPAADVRRALDRVAKIRAHFVMLRNGQAAWNIPLARVAYHAQRVLNAADVGIEIDGWYSGIDGDPKTFWKPRSRPNRKPMDPTVSQIENGRSLIRWIVETVAANGGEVRHIHAHRQTHRGKPSDPGELIWSSLGVWARHTLGLDYALDDGGEIVPHKRDRRGGVWSTAGPGRPIPTEWDPDQPTGYRSK